MSELARALLEELAGDPVALERLRELVAPPPREAEVSAAAYTPRTLAVELGRSERSIRDAINRGELAAVKRGRGWVIGADAVADWARGRAEMNLHAESSRPPRRRRSGLSREALKRAMT